MKVLILLVTLLAPSFADACTFGTNCYCDKVVPVAGSLYDSSLLFCEDFEAPTLRDNVGFGVTTASARGSGGTNAYGPWYDDTGQTGDRGRNSYWNKKYGNGASGFLWSSGLPTSPEFGVPCAFALCVGHRTWDSADRWNGNLYSPRMAIFDEASDFSAEVGTLSAPTNTANGGSAGCFDGTACLVYRVQPNNVNGIAGGPLFASPVFEIGLTMAVAYPTNSLSSGVWGTDAVPAAWKHNEWGTDLAPNCGFDGLFIFYNQNGPRSGRPFAGFMTAAGADCLGGKYTGSITNVSAGAASSSANGLVWNSPTGYSQATDWPEGTWGCVRGHVLISGGTIRHRVWFQGPNDSSERLLIDFTATTDGLDARNGYDHMKWNGYANTNQGGGYIATNEVTFRFEDNVHARQGLPVSCAQIGFTGGGGGPGGKGSMDVKKREHRRDLHAVSYTK